MSTYKFAKQMGGKGCFAAISLDLLSNVAAPVEWAASLEFYERIYGAAVTEGIQDALDWHVAAGGEPGCFLVTDFIDFPVDTKPDAVRCAATMAAWKSLGHDENGIIFYFTDECRAKRNC